MKMMQHCVVFAIMVSLTTIRVLADGTAMPVATNPTPMIAPQPVALSPMPPSGSLWNATTAPIVVPKRFSVGDLITVNIALQSSTAQSANHATSKNEADTISPGTGMFSGLTGLGMTAARSTAGTGSSTSSTQMTDNLTVTVTRILPSGNLAIEGTREIKLEKDDMLITFNGEVRPQDVQPDNTIASQLVANQHLTTKGAGPIAEKQRPGWFARLMQYLW